MWKSRYLGIDGCIFYFMKSFENKVVVVTGGAHGIGATIVSEFEKEGAKVAYIDIRENPCFVGDLSKKDVLEKFAQFVIEKIRARGCAGKQRAPADEGH